MFDRNALPCAVLLLTVATPVFAQDTKPSTASEDVIQDPMPRSRAAVTARSGPAQTQPAQPQASESPARPTAPVDEKVAQAAPKTAYSINPALLLLGGIGAELDTAVDPSISLFVAPSFIFGKSVFESRSGVSMTGFGFDVGLRYFSAKGAPKGFWVGPYAGAAFVTASTGTTAVSATALGFGGMLGYSWIADSSFYFSIGAGGGYRAVLVDAGSSNAAAGGAGLSLRLALGFAK